MSRRPRPAVAHHSQTSFQLNRRRSRPLTDHSCQEVPIERRGADAAPLWMSYIATLSSPCRPCRLPKALSWPSGDELEALGAAVGDERRRRLLTSEGVVAIGDRTGEPNAPKSLKAAEPRVRKTVVERPRLTIARVSAIRAGFKAGVKPSILARQFGVTLAAIREALTDTGG